MYPLYSGWAHQLKNEGKRRRRTGFIDCSGPRSAVFSSHRVIYKRASASGHHHVLQSFLFNYREANTWKINQRMMPCKNITLAVKTHFFQSLYFWTLFSVIDKVVNIFSSLNEKSATFNLIVFQTLWSFLIFDKILHHWLHWRNPIFQNTFQLQFWNGIIF